MRRLLLDFIRKEKQIRRHLRIELIIGKIIKKKTKHIFLSFSLSLFLSFSLSLSFPLSFYLTLINNKHQIFRFVYLLAGTKQTFSKNQVHQHLELEIDGQPTEIPGNSAGIFVINVNNYGGGHDLWKNSKARSTDKLKRYKSAAPDDGLLEVLSCKSIFNLGMTWGENCIHSCFIYFIIMLGCYIYIQLI